MTIVATNIEDITIVDSVKNSYSGETAKLTEEEIKQRPNRLNQIIFLIALAITLNAFFTPSESKEMLKIGDHIPPFTLKLTDGKEIANTDFQNKSTMYFFYAGWCPCSHQSIKFIKRAYSDSSDALSVLGIGIQDSQKKLEEFAILHKLTFPVSSIGGNSVANSIGVKTTPTTILADSDGIIRWIFVGKIERYDQLQDGLQKILPPLEIATT